MGDSTMSSVLKVDEIQNTDGKTGLVITPDGSIDGIKFPEEANPSGRTITSTTMSSYEEGTFTPTVTFGAGSVGQVYGKRYAYYTKIGQNVTVTFYILLINKGTSTGDAYIEGMPFRCKSRDAYAAGSLHLNRVSFTGFPQAYHLFGTTTVTLGKTTDAGVYDALTSDNFTTEAGIIFTSTYFTDE
jgi:hypothetical protein